MWKKKVKELDLANDFTRMRFYTENDLQQNIINGIKSLPK